MTTLSNTHIVPITTTLLLRQMIAAHGQRVIVEENLAMRAKTVQTLARTDRLEVPMLGVAPLFDEVRLITRTRPNWALYNLSHDPLYKTGKFPLPARDLRRLKHLYYAGIQFDAMYVAHELPLDFQPGQDNLEMSLFVPAPPVFATHLAEHLGHAANRIVSACLALTGKPFAILASAGASAAAVLRDPILMGVVIPPGTNPDPGVPAVWFLLAAWRW